MPFHSLPQSYFYKKENLLSGLIFNKENITIRPEYETILRFYGYDIDTTSSMVTESQMNNEQMMNENVTTSTTAEPSSTEEQQTTLEQKSSDAPETSQAPETTVQSETTKGEEETTEEVTQPAEGKCSNNYFLNFNFNLKTLTARN